MMLQSPLGFECRLFDEEALSSGDIDLALKRLPPGDGSQLLYRGWILAEELYRRFHGACRPRATHSSVRQSIMRKSLTSPTTIPKSVISLRVPSGPKRPIHSLPGVYLADGRWPLRHQRPHQVRKAPLA